MSSVAFANGESWPVWSAWKWLMPTYFTCSGFTFTSARRSTMPTFGAFGFEPGAKPVSQTMYSSPCLIR